MEGTKDSRTIAAVRVQRKRTKGYRLPSDTVSVCRPGKFGNPFTIKQYRDAGVSGTDAELAALAVAAFRDWLCDGETDEAKAEIINNLSSLRGKNLACFCSLDSPCHADVLLEYANAGAHAAGPS